MRRYLFISFLLLSVFGLNCGSSQPKQKVYLKEREIAKYNNLPSNIDMYVMKKNGSYDERPNDLEELCKDYIYYRKKIAKSAAEGSADEAAKARGKFNEVNQYLADYQEKDIQDMFSLIEKGR